MQKLKHDCGPRGSGARANIYLLGDVHLGHIGCHKRLFKQHLDEVRQDPEGHLFLVGDLLDSVAVADKRFALSQVDPDLSRAHRDDIINQQIELACDLLGPVVGKIRLMLMGNHEERIVQVASADPLLVVAQHLGLPEGAYQGAYSAYARLRWQEKVKEGPNTRPHLWKVDLALHHGAGGGRKPGAKVNRVDERASWWPTADIVASGHNHSRTVTERVGIAVAEREMAEEEKVQLCVNTGSYLRTYMFAEGGAHYGEKADYPPSALGGVRVSVEMQTRHEGSRHIRSTRLRAQGL